MTGDERTNGVMGIEKTARDRILSRVVIHFVCKHTETQSLNFVELVDGHALDRIAVRIRLASSTKAGGAYFCS